MAKFMDRVKELRAEYRLTLRDVAKATGLSHSAISAYEKGKREPGFESLEALADVFNCDIDYLLGRTDEKNENARQLGYNSFVEAFASTIRPIKRSRLPMLGNVPCGEPTFAAAEEDTYIDVENDFGADFCLTAKGDSMINARIFDGDILFVKSCPIVSDGEIAVVIIGEEATVKRFFYDKENNIVTLVPENPMFKPMRFIGHEIDNVRVLGRVVAGQFKI